MSDEIKLTQQEYLLAEVVMKVAALERLLIKAGIITPDNLLAEMKTVSDEVISFVEKKAEETSFVTDTKDKDSN